MLSRWMLGWRDSSALWAAESLVQRAPGRGPDHVPGARYQADRQGQAAHEQWLRQIRRDAYSAFLSHASAASEVIKRGAARRPLSAEELDTLALAAVGMRQGMGALMLEAGPSVRARAAWITACTEILHRMLSRATVEDDAHPDSVAWMQSYARLVDECSKSLKEPAADPA
jgi:hypothetical protein